MTPRIDLRLITQLRSVSVLMPSRWPTRAIDPRDSPVSARSSKTICTARSRSSAKCDFNFPRGHSLQGTRGSPKGGGQLGATLRCAGLFLAFGFCAVAELYFAFRAR
jgi:hypothetical protein